MRRSAAADNAVKEQIITFRRNLYYLCDIHDHRTAIERLT
jgi:hypothetical protein